MLGSGQAEVETTGGWEGPGRQTQDNMPKCQNKLHEVLWEHSRERHTQNEAEKVREEMVESPPRGGERGTSNMSGRGEGRG